MLFGRIIEMETMRSIINVHPMVEHPGERLPGFQIYLQSRVILQLQFLDQTFTLFGMTIVMDIGRFITSVPLMRE
ncbi:hypothetical protein ES703_102856 [subsurface metagenome]